MQVLCDGEELDIPPESEGLLFLNIPSFMGGLDLWGSGYDHHGVRGDTGPQSINDGKLEVRVLPNACYFMMPSFADQHCWTVA